MRSSVLKFYLARNPIPRGEEKNQDWAATFPSPIQPGLPYNSVSCLLLAVIAPPTPPVPAVNFYNPKLPVRI